jgi:hypothetical protein
LARKKRGGVMASPLYKAGVDLDTLFMARVNAKRAEVGIKVAGVDISNRYETIGGAAAIAATGFKAAGIDIGSLFRGVGAFNMVAGYYDTGAGNIYTGYYAPTGTGTLTPNTYAGSVIQYMMDLYSAGAPGFYLYIDGIHPQNFFTSLVINGHTFASAAAGYTAPSYTQWFWSGIHADLGSGGSYPVVMS